MHKAVALLAGIGLLSLACGQTVPASSQPSPAGGAEAGKPKMGGVFTKAIPNDFFDYDPTYGGQSVPNPNATTLAYDRLVAFKTGPDVKYGDYQLLPSLADKWEVAPDGKSFTFSLHKGVKFANMPPVNGREFTSADVKWSLEYHQRGTPETGKGKPKGSYTFTTENLDSIDTPDPYTVTVRFKQPFAPFMNYAATYNMVMMPKEIFQQDGDLRNRIVGTGPFQLDMGSSQKGGRWVFKKNPTYFQEGKPYLDEFRYLVLPDEATRLAAFKTKQIDFYDTTELAPAKEVKTIPNIVFESNLDPAPNSLYISQAKAPLNDLKVRKALSLSIDRDEFIKVMSDGEGQWRLPGSRPGDWTEAEIKQVLKYDPAESKRLLAEAGFPNGVKLKLLNRAADAGGATKSELLLQSQLKKGGFDVEIDAVSKAEGTPRLYTGQFDMILLYEKRFADVDSFLWDQNHSSGMRPVGTTASNWIRVNDPKMDQLIEAQRAAVDPVKRTAALKEAARYMNDMVYMQAVYPRYYYFAYHPYVKGYYSQDMVSYSQDWGIKDIWLDK